MTLNANKIQGGGVQAPVLEPGNYPARVVQVIDLGLQPQRPFDGQAKPPANELNVTYELAGEFMPDEDGNPDPEKPRWVSERFPLFSLRSERAKSTKRMEALDPTLETGGDWSKIPGKPCLVAVVNNVSNSNGKTYNNVGGISPPIRGMEIPELVNQPKTFDLSNPDMEVFESLPDFIKGIICANLEFAGSALAVALGAAQSIPDVPKAANPGADMDRGPAIADNDVPF